MPVVPNDIKHFGDAQGLDVRSTKLTQRPGFFPIFKNVRKKDEWIIKRPGFHMFGQRSEQASDEASMHYGPFTHTYFDSETGATKQELLALSSETSGSKIVRLIRFVERIVTIEYSGASASATFSLLPVIGNDGSQSWQYILKEEDAIVLDVTEGDGLGDSLSGQTLIEMLTTIDGVTGFTYGTDVASAGDVHLSVLGPIEEVSCKPSVTFKVYDWEYVSFTSQTELEVQLEEAQPGFVVPDAKNYDQVMLFAANDYLYKYDGLRFYRAGLERGQLLQITYVTGSGPFDETDVHFYKIRVKRVDYRERIIHGRDSDPAAPFTESGSFSGSSNNRIITYKNVTDGDFLPRSAVVNGNHTTQTTITVDSGHTIEVDDVVYFHDAVEGGYITRNVTAITTTSITIDGAAVTVSDNAVVSNNIRIEIWRSKNQGVDYFFLAELPNNSLSASSTYTDTVADTNLGDQFKVPERGWDLPPKCKYIEIHQDLVALSGDPDNPNGIYWSDAEGGPEAFPEASNQSDIGVMELGAITGIASTGDDVLMVCKERDAIPVVGDLDSLQFRALSPVSADLGVVSHHTLQRVKDSYMGLSRRGPVILQGREISLAPGFPLSSDFRRQDYEQVVGDAITSDQQIKMVLKRAISVNYEPEAEYRIAIPCESGVSGQVKGANPLLPNVNSRIYVFDYEDLLWSRWETKKAAMFPYTGMTVFKNNLYFGGLFSRTESANEIRVSQLYRERDEGDIFDFADGNYSIEFDIATHWEAEGDPDMLKKALRCKLYQLQENDFVGAFTLTIEEYRNFNGTTKYTQTTRQFSTSTDTEKIVKFIGGKVRAIQLRLKNDVLFQGPILTGYSLQFANPYRRAMKDRKGGS